MGKIVVSFKDNSFDPMGLTDKFLSKWLEYGEYISVEFDTEKNTARVLTSQEAKETE